MRTITDHIASGDQSVQLRIEATDDPGAGGANHRYEIGGFTAAANRSNDYLIAGASEIPPAVLGGDVTCLTASHAALRSNCAILFQNGPIKENGVNGITQEALLAIVIDRLRSFQGGPFSCRENAIALTHCEEAIMWLQRRTVSRIKRGVEGTNQK